MWLHLGNFSQTSRDSELEAMKVDIHLKPSRKAPTYELPTDTQTRGHPPSSATYVLTSTPITPGSTAGRVLKHFILGSTCPLETHTSMDPCSSESPKTSSSSSLKAPEGPETSSSSSLKASEGHETFSFLKFRVGPETSSSSSLKAPEGPGTSFYLKAPEGRETSSSSSLKFRVGPDTSFLPKAPELA